MNDLVGQLQEAVRGEVFWEADALREYSLDASIFEVVPQAVVKPQDLHDLQNLVRFVRAKQDEGVRLSLTPRNGGTDMSGGPLNEHIIVDLGNFTAIHDVDERTRQVSVGAGTMFRDIAARLDEHHLMFGAYTSSKDICGIGGMLGNNASGEKSIRFGATTDNTRSIHVVLADGNEYEFGPLDASGLEAKCHQQDHEGYLYRSVRDLINENQHLLERHRPKVRKNAAGYDLWRVWDAKRHTFNMAHLFIGSQGTLGTITGARLLLQPQPEHIEMVVIGISDLTTLSEAVQTVLNHNPEGLEVYDSYTYKLAKEHMPEDAKAAASAEGKEMVLLAQFSEPTKPRTEQIAQLVHNELKKKGYSVTHVTDERERTAHWNIRRASYKLLKDFASGDMRAAPFIEDTIVSTTHFGEFVAALKAVLSDFDLTYAYHGHIGDGSLRVFPLINFEDPDATRIVSEVSRRVFDLVLAFDGSISVDHNDGLAKSPYLPDMYGDAMMQVFAQVKEIFDPTNMFNPGKKVGASLSYSLSHLSQSNKGKKLQ